nr:MAG TPA: hypothetical protein [Caudoviricetes sp.]
MYFRLLSARVLLITLLLYVFILLCLTVSCQHVQTALL